MDLLGLSNVIIVLIALFALLGLTFLVAAIVALRHGRLVRHTTRLGLSLILLAGAAAFALLGAGTQGYRALTHEDVAATVDIQPVGPQRFQARIRLPDGKEMSRTLDGDEFYIDAHVLKWKPVANLIGLHTAYALDRFGGRYLRLNDEQQAPRTIYGLNTGHPFDLFDLRRRYSWLSPLVDAEYGSATFVAANEPCKLEVRVSTSGLLIRRVTPASGN